METTNKGKKETGTVGRLVDLLIRLPDDKRNYVVMATESFISGMRAQEDLSNEKETA